ncbi:hypothetical protein ACFQMA_05325 [Halosimplex aquaticum]|uniref:Uncharacterized protein n=1 Tax=Halosimplex aquaticum TaxID=3026162 RepID=A0ABD5Y095_9EURY|nr:hypothetical protein [Halosimplex aquaticum]
MSSGECGSRHTNETNSVTPSQPGNSADDERELPTPAERVAEFREEYGHLARLPLTEVPGQRLRASLLEEYTTEVEVEPLTDQEDATTVFELDKRVPLTWEAAVEQLLESYEDSRNTTLKLERGYEGHPEHEVFHKDAETSWMPSYQKRYFAELKGWVRETIGGTRPSGGECPGKFENPHLALLTRTASSVPDGDRRPPVDHTEQVRTPWEGVYHTLRNRLRSLGFESDQWDYYRKEEPHKSERGGSLNSCYTHEHVMLIVDGEVSAEDFRPVMDKHVEDCDWAGDDAHSVERAVEVLPADEVEDVAAYVASYTGIQPAGLLERSIEYVAWAATQWAANRKRRTRSNAAGWAATADACKQRFESDKSEQEVTHGEEIVVSDRRGVEYECAECGSPWGIDQDQTLTAARLSAGDSGGTTAVADGGVEVPDREEQLREQWPSATAAATVGETPTERKKRQAIESHLKRHPNATVTEVLGLCSLPPDDASLVREVMAGVDRSEAVGFDDPPDWRLDAVIVEDEEHPAASGGGVDMAEVVMPVERLLNETRLQYHGNEQSPTIVVHGSDGPGESVASYSARGQAARLVGLGYREPWAAELRMEFQRRHPDHDLVECFEEPECRPPSPVRPG